MRRNSTGFEQPWVRPFLRWAGSKRKLVATLMRHAPSSFHRYIEPFAGSACLFFALRPAAAVLGDINAELIRAYKTIGRHPRRVARLAGSFPNDARTYYRLRGQSVDVLDDIEGAARFLYLNRYCFNGVYRTNRKGAFNVPRGRQTGALPSESTLYRCSIALRTADLRAGDFETCLADVQQGDFVYLDPPYASVDRPRYGEYGYGSFAKNDLERLLAVLCVLDGRGATFLLSYQDTGQLGRLPKEWHRRRVSIRRHVAGFAQDRRIVREVLVSNQLLRRAR